MSRVWLVTGCSAGFGEEFVKQILDRGERVIATARNVDKITHLKAAGAATIALDVNESSEVIKEIISQAHQVYGQIDVLVNNAGFFQLGTVEETTTDQIFTQFNTNVFGVIKVTQAILPYMRARKSGVIVNMGSMAAYYPAPGGALYSATKAALEVVSEGLREEVKDFGISVIVVDPGYFRTQFLGVFTEPANRIADYSKLTDNLITVVKQINGKQSGDPKKGVQRIIDIVSKKNGKDIPSRLALGADSYGVIRNKCEETIKQLDEWKDSSVGTDIDN